MSTRVDRLFDLIFFIELFKRKRVKKSIREGDKFFEVLVMVPILQKLPTFACVNVAFRKCENILLFYSFVLSLFHITLPTL